MDIKKCQVFRNLAKENGLSIERFEIDEPKFLLDLNQGEIYTLCDPERVFELVKLSHKIGNKEHKAIMQLVAKGDQLKNLSEQKIIIWQRPYNVNKENKDYVY